MLVWPVAAARFVSNTRTAKDEGLRDKVTQCAAYTTAWAGSWRPPDTDRCRGNASINRQQTKERFKRALDPLPAFALIYKS